MIATEFSLSHRELSLHTYHWSATANPNGKAIGIIHGLGEHAGRYSNVASYFCSQGYEVFAFDHQGHGQSDGAKGTIQSWESFVSQIDTFRKAIEGALDTPHDLLLWGHSMGGLVLLDYLSTRKEASTLYGAVVTSPPLKLASPPPKILTSLASVISSLAPTLTKSNELNASDLSHDQVVVETYKTDPNNHDRVSMLLGYELLDTPKRLLAKSQSMPVPVLFMHGDADRICDVAGTNQFVKEVTGDVQLKIWPGLFHETHNEPEQLDVFAYAKTWIASIAES
ncbi:MAG: lysophospholipase [Saprospiraceae bacterium]